MRRAGCAVYLTPGPSTRSQALSTRFRSGRRSRMPKIKKSGWVAVESAGGCSRSWDRPYFRIETGLSQFSAVPFARNAMRDLGSNRDVGPRSNSARRPRRPNVPSRVVCLDPHSQDVESSEKRRPTMLNKKSSVRLCSFHFLVRRIPGSKCQGQLPTSRGRCD